MFSRDIVYCCSYSLLFLESHFEALKALCKVRWSPATSYRTCQIQGPGEPGPSKHLFSEAVFRGRPALFPGLCSRRQQSDIPLQGLSRLDSGSCHLTRDVFTCADLCLCLTPACPDTAFGYRPGLAGTPSLALAPTHTGFSFPTPNRALVVTGLYRAQDRTNPPSPVPFRLFKMHEKPNLG